MKTIGYFEEYITNKFLGCLPCEKKDREIGYYGTVYKIAERNIKLDNGKIIKKGQEYHTRYYPLNGR